MLEFLCHFISSFPFLPSSFTPGKGDLTLHSQLFKAVSLEGQPWIFVLAMVSSVRRDPASGPQDVSL